MLIHQHILGLARSDARKASLKGAASRICYTVMRALEADNEAGAESSYGQTCLARVQVTAAREV